MNKKIKLFFVLSAASFLSLVACNNNANKNTSSSVDPNVNPYIDLVEETNEAIIDDLKVVNAEGVYGNVRLPEDSNGASISWWSSNPDIINPHYEDDIAPGKVNRQENDEEVTLVAQIEKDGNKTKFEQKVTVKATPEAIEDDDYEAYLFGHFIGESYGENKNGVKVATGEQMFFALADVGQGLHFKDMNGSSMSNLKPVLSSNVGERGVRDPFILRSPEGDTFYLIATDLSVYTRGGWGQNNGENKFTINGSRSITLWESHDLVNWTEARLIEAAAPNAGMAWAPEMIYSEETGEYVIFFSSTIIEDKAIRERDCIYYTTTRDFVHFGETKKFIKNQPYPEGKEDPQKAQDSPKAINNNERKIIDASVMKIGDWYYSACKDGDNHEDGGILIQKTQKLFDIDSWQKVLDLDDLGFKSPWSYRAPNGSTKTVLNNNCLEGPEWFVLNQSDRSGEDKTIPEYGLMADFYADTSKGYMPFATKNIEDADNSQNSWRQLKSGTDYSWDAQTKRHGTILRITADEAERLKEAYPFAA